MEVDTFLSSFETIQFPIHGIKVPQFVIPDKFKVEVATSNFDFLKGLCREGFSKKIKAEKGTKEFDSYVERLEYELSLINELGFVDYMLLVWDVVNFCNENKIPVGPGRGSAAGSLILYLIGATKVDPIRYELYFERFISKIRAKKKVVDGITYLDGKLMCDVDIDICYYNRHKVLKYLEEKFVDRNSKIVTVTTLSGKLLIKECGKIVGDKEESEMNEVSGMIPKKFGNVRDIQETYEGLKDDKGGWENEPIEGFVKWCNENEEVYKIALKLRDLIKNKSVHASGVLLSYDPLNDSIPQELVYHKKDKAWHKVASYTMEWATLLNIKLDILGNKSVSIVDDICKSMNLDIDSVDLNDPFIYKNLQELKLPHGLFQIEADTILRVCKQVRPRNLEELSGVISIGRPGSLIYVENYADFINNGTVISIHPFFDDILGKTGGICIYQEQLMKMAHKIGFTLDEAEVIRRIVGKKQVEKMVEWEKKVEDKVKEQKLDPAISGIFWKVLDANKDYSFNKSHGAAYAVLAAHTAYLKFKYPTEFYLSLLRMTRNEITPIVEISKIQKELRFFDIKLLPPHLLKSKMDFTVEDKNIRFGLLSIKGVKEKSIEKLNHFRTEYSNKFEIFKGAEEAGLSFGILYSLIQAGALEGLKQPRSFVVLEAQVWKLLTDKEKKYFLQLGEKFEYNTAAIIKHLTTFNDEKGKPVIKDTRLVTIRKHAEPFFKIHKQNSKSEKFANWYYERTLLGYSSQHQLMDVFSEQIPDLVSIQQVVEEMPEIHVKFTGIVAEDPVSAVGKKINKNGKKTRYFRMLAVDETDQVTVLLFNNGIDNCKDENGDLPAKDNIVVVEGVKKADAVFANRIVIQDCKIYMRLKEIEPEPEEENEKKLDKKPSSS